MSSRRSSFAWISYALVYVVGCAALVYVNRTGPRNWSVAWWAFMFPLVLVGMAFLIERAEGTQPPRIVPGALSITGHSYGVQRVPARPTTVIALTMLISPLAEISPAHTGAPSMELVFIVWWLGCAAFVAFLVPLLLGKSHPPDFTDHS